jgi:hypothetical protein
MEPQPVFVTSDKVAVKYHLSKAIHGLKQAGRDSQEVVKNILIRMGFKVSRAGRCRSLKGNTFVPSNVDDGLIAATAVAGCNQVIHVLEEN